MMLSIELREQLKRKRSIYVAEACDGCGALLGAVRFTLFHDSGVWCSRECRDGAGAHATCRKRENRKSQTAQISRDGQLKTQGLQTRSEVLPVMAHSGTDRATETLPLRLAGGQE